MQPNPYFTIHVISQVKVWLRDSDGEILDSFSTAWGQGRVTQGNIGDARKSGQTNALKKALSYFSIGIRSYHGLLKG